MPKSLSAQAKTAISHPLIRILLSVVLSVTAFGILLITLTDFFFRQDLDFKPCCICND